MPEENEEKTFKDAGTQVSEEPEVKKYDGKDFVNLEDVDRNVEEDDREEFHSSIDDPVLCTLGRTFLQESSTRWQIFVSIWCFRFFWLLKLF
jgi:hypothetical protein